MISKSLSNLNNSVNTGFGLDELLTIVREGCVLMSWSFRDQERDWLGCTPWFMFHWVWNWDPSALQMLSLDFSYFFTNHENLAAFPSYLLNGMSQILKQWLQVPPWAGPQQGNAKELVQKPARCLQGGRVAIPFQGKAMGLPVSVTWGAQRASV